MFDERRAGKVLVLVVSTCVVVLAGTATLGLMPGAASALGVNVGAAPAYSEGQLVDVPADLYRDSRFTVIAFVRSSCSVCRESQPALRALAKSIEKDSAVRMVLATSTSESEWHDEELFGREIGVLPSSIVSIPAATVRLKWVPSLLLVDRTGRILKVQEGLIDSSAATDWIDSVARLVRS